MCSNQSLYLTSELWPVSKSSVWDHPDRAHNIRQKHPNNSFECPSRNYSGRPSQRWRRAAQRAQLKDEEHSQQVLTFWWKSGGPAAGGDDQGLKQWLHWVLPQRFEWFQRSSSEPRAAPVVWVQEETNGGNMNINETQTVKRGSSVPVKPSEQTILIGWNSICWIWPEESSMFLLWF